MSVKKIYKRERAGLIFAHVGEAHNDLFRRMVAEDHSDGTKFLRWLIEEEWKRRGNSAPPPAPSPFSKSENGEGGKKVTG